MNERDHKDNQEASWIQLIINVSYKVVEVLFRPLDLEHHPVKTEFPLELKKVVEISSNDLRETNTGPLLLDLGGDELRHIFTGDGVGRQGGEVLLLEPIGGKPGNNLGRVDPAILPHLLNPAGIHIMPSGDPEFGLATNRRKKKKVILQDMESAKRKRIPFRGLNVEPHRRDEGELGGMGLGHIVAMTARIDTRKEREREKRVKTQGDSQHHPREIPSPSSIRN